jgi:calcineurin-like phosphoesterase
VSAVVGTHTHVQTADERILPGGTAYISDIGMVGSLNSMIGFKKESALRAMMTQMPVRFEVDYEGPYVFCAVLLNIDVETGKALSIERIRIIDDTLALTKE